jgi:hypothetical protein
MRKTFAILCLLLATPVYGQVQQRPTDPPLVTAVNESWYRLREPIQFAGELYYPAGATVFFNGNVMVRTGHYNGVPLYADTTVEPYSIVLVPTGRGLMQPYERPRRGDVAGTTGSRSPSFPVAVASITASSPQAAVAPSAPPVPVGAVSTFTPEGAVGTSGTAAPRQAASGAIPPAPRMRTAVPGTVGTRGFAARTASSVITLRRPDGNQGLWISYAGGKWVSAGPTVIVDGTFSRTGHYDGFPVFTRTGQADVIYVPTVQGIGMVAPYTRAR